MKIGITCHPSTGGSGILATELGIALAERGHTVHFVTAGAPFRLIGFHDNLYSHVVSTVTYPLFSNPPGSLALAAQIADVAEEHGIELWHAHYAIPNAFCAIAARDMMPPDKRFKVVTTLHGTDITLVGIDPSFFRVTKYAMEHSDAVTAVSNWLNDETHRDFNLQKPVRTIYNFLDLDKFDPSRNHCLSCKNEKMIMHISNFRPVKRVTDVVRVFKKVLESVPARLVMVGEGPERLSAVGVAKQLGIADRITWLGVHERIETIIPCADLILHPSEHESFGLVPLEAMASEVPVICTRSGGVCEVVEDGLCGYLCEVGDIDTMAQRAVAILTDPDLADRLGKAGRARAQEMFTKERIVLEYEALYRELIEDRVPVVDGAA